MHSNLITGSRSIRGALLLACAAAVVCLSALTPRADPASAQKANRFIGAAKCKLCHGSADTGNQFAALSKMKHAHAFETLSGDESKKLAAAKGIADATKDEKCVKCHVTAFGVPDEQIAKGFDKTLGVQCESCHGPGEQHMKARLAAAGGDSTGSAKYVAVPAGEIIVDPPTATCTGCHNTESPNYKPFCAHKFKAQIRHLNPLKPRTAEEKAKLLACSCDASCTCNSTAPDGKCPGEKP